MAGKSPISLLNEIFITKGQNPQFDLVRNETGVHNPVFEYRVTVGDLYATGSGRSKQIAKHQAAQNLLDFLNSRNANEISIDMSQVSVPVNNTVDHNAVGELKDYCSERNHPDPTYNLIADEGPPHARKFTMQCSVSKLYEIAEARTKKQAKHIASKQMLVRLKAQAGEEYHPIVAVGSTRPADDLSAFPPSTASDEMAIEKYNELKGYSNTQRPGALYKDHEAAFLDLKEKSITLAQFLQEKQIDKATANAILTKIAAEMNLTLNEFLVESKPKEGIPATLEKLVFLSLNTSPPITSLGLGRDDSAFQFLKSLSILCK